MGEVMEVEKEVIKDDSARSPIAGCAILVVLVLVMGFLVVFSVWSLFKQADEIEKFTETKARLVERVELSEPEWQQVVRKWEKFLGELEDGSREARVSLSLREVNGVISREKSFEDLRGMLVLVDSVGVSAEHPHGLLKADLSFQMNGRPRLTREGEVGTFTADARYLNGRLAGFLDLGKGEVALRIEGISVPNQAVVPEPFLRQMSPYRIMERYAAHPQIGGVMKKLTKVELGTNEVTLVRAPHVTPPDTFSRDQIDSGVQRFFTVLGGFAAVFLMLMGLLLWVGLRLKKRKENS